jgi:hypothetical protein
MSWTIVRTLAVLLSVNLGLWILMWSFSLPLSDDLVLVDRSTASLQARSGGPGVTG